MAGEPQPADRRTVGSPAPPWVRFPSPPSRKPRSESNCASALWALTPCEEKHLARLDLGRTAEQRGEGRCDRGEEAAVLREGLG
jgi:hypothetical protein